MPCESVIRGVWLELGHTADSLVRATLQDSDFNFENESELTLEAPIVTHIQFLPTTTLPDQTDRSWELLKWSLKMECCDVRTNSL